jgi:predicted transposase YdaD
LSYARYQDDLRYEASLIESNYGLGRLEGREEGLTEGIEQGMEKGKLEVAKRLLENGVP